MKLGVALANAGSDDRHATDFYPTPPEVTHALLDYLDLPQGLVVWEPACGAGHMARVMAERGLRVTATELHGQGYGREGVDFLTAEAEECDWIITNPPFKLAEQFITRCLKHARPFAMLVKSQYWHSARRASLFERHRPSAVLPLTWRPDFHFGAKGGSPTMECLWTVWDGCPARVTDYVPLRKSRNDNQQSQADLFSAVVGLEGVEKGVVA